MRMPSLLFGNPNQLVDIQDYCPPLLVCEDLTPTVDTGLMISIFHAEINHMVELVWSRSHLDG